MKKLSRYLIVCVTILAFAVNISFGQVRIAVSKLSGSYEAWLLGADPDAVIVNMYGMKVGSAAGTQVAHRCPPGSQNCLHSVKIDKQSDLYRLTSIENGTVNSFHHQAVDMVAPGMKITALSENGVAEAIEQEFPLAKSFIMGVQWHPEKLERNAGLSKPLADYFLEQVSKYKQDHNQCPGCY